MPKAADKLLTARASKASEIEAKTTGHHLLEEPNDGSSEPMRFSMRRDMEGEGGGSSRRVLLYVAIVVALGIGLTLLVQSLVSNQTPSTQPETTPETEEEEQIAGVDISKFQLADSSAERTVTKDQYGNTELALGSNSNDMTSVTLEKISHEAYTTFTQINWQLTAGATGLPQTAIAYDKDLLEITVTFTGLNPAVGTDFLREIPLKLGAVTKIVGSQESGNLTFVLSLTEASKFAAFVSDNNVLELFIKTEAELEKPEVVEEVPEPEPEVEPTPEVPEPTPTPTTPPAGGVDYDNDPSTNSQAIVSNASGNGIFSETYYYVDYGDSFQFSWAMRGEGEASIPNATAAYVTDSGKDYIEVKISNLGYDLLHNKAREKAVINVSTASSNLVDVYTKGFTGGTATFWVEVKAKKNFRLHSTQTFGGYQLVSLWLAD